MTKLKRCPFCGGEAEISVGYGFNKKPVLYTPHCKNEYCEGYAGRAYESKKLAISMWNTRTPEIVRCGECRHFDGSEIAGQCALTTPENLEDSEVYWETADFCSYGERREENGKRADQ